MTEANMKQNDPRDIFGADAGKGDKGERNDKADAKAASKAAQPESMQPCGYIDALWEQGVDRFALNALTVFENHAAKNVSKKEYGVVFGRVDLRDGNPPRKLAAVYRKTAGPKAAEDAEDALYLLDFEADDTYIVYRESEAASLFE